MGQMIGDVFRRLNQVLRQAAVCRHRDAGRSGQRGGGGGGLCHRTDAADAWHQYQRIGGSRPISMFSKPRYSEDDTCAERTWTVGDVEADFEVALDAVERADQQARRHCRPVFFVAGSGSG